ncbi:MAG: hypothetical protein BGN85_08780 [Alphaproteobacteria bacterium 64-11]|nr:MAG: hypothetical protein BGN85_08780 [Alphaproteobacteria bacterium 64-11]
MQAKVIREFKGRQDHEAVTRTFRKDDIIEGELATVAVREKWAIEIKPERAETRREADDAAARAAAEAKAKDEADKKAAEDAAKKAE